MNEIYEKLEACVKAVQRKTDFQPQIALVLGSGLGDYADTIRIEQTVEYREIEGFPMSTVAGHNGAVCVRVCGKCPSGGNAGPGALLRKDILWRMSCFPFG